MKNIGIPGWEVSEIGAFHVRFGGVTNVQLFRFLLKEKRLERGKIDGLWQET